jgi:exodeoxyribonuclease X
MSFTPVLIRVLDLETTGFPPDADVIEIAAVDVGVAPFALPRIFANGDPSLQLHAMVHPGRPIPPESSAVHHIIDEDVGSAAPWPAVWPEFVASAVNVFCAHSAKFERAFISDEMTGGKPWICTWKCALRLFPQAPSHSNQALRYFLKPPGLDRDKAALAHRAWPYAYITAHLLALMLERTGVDELVAWSAEPALLPRVPFGKPPPSGARGLPWREADEGLLYWTLERDFDEDIIFTVKHELERRAKEREQERAAAGDGEDVEDGDRFPDDEDDWR